MGMATPALESPRQTRPQFFRLIINRIRYRWGLRLPRWACPAGWREAGRRVSFGLGELIATLMILILIQSPPWKSLSVVILWSFLLAPWSLRRVTVMAVVSIVFAVNDILAVRQGIFAFTQPDFLGLPAWEYVAWGYYLFHTIRVLRGPLPSRPQPVMWGLLTAFALCFALNLGDVGLFLGTGGVLLGALFFFHSPWDFAYVGYMVLFGAILEYGGVLGGLWNYPHPPRGGVPLWFIPMWGGIGFFTRRLLLPRLGRDY